MSVKKHLLSYAAVGAALVVTGQGQDHGGTGEKSNQANSAAVTQQNLHSRDRAFLMTAAEEGMMEVQVAQAALERASNAEVKAFAQRLVNDHTKANQELMNLAGQKSIDVTPNAEQTKRSAVEPLLKLSGAEFDKAFIRHQIAHHQKDVAHFEQQARNAADPDVKAFASKQLPTLREHLETARNLTRQIH